VLAEQARGLIPVEIKSGKTLAGDWTHSLKKWITLAEGESRNPVVVYGGDQRWEQDGIRFVPWREVSDWSRDL
jgi:hypothetical protein